MKIEHYSFGKIIIDGKIYTGVTSQEPQSSIIPDPPDNLSEAYMIK